MKNLIVFIFIATCMALHAEVYSWQLPAGMVSQKYYNVKVNGINVPVYDTPICSYATFDFTGEVNVEVSSSFFDARWVDIRPLQSNIKPVYTSGNSFSFKMKRPQNLSVELNGRIREQPLFIFAGKPESVKPLKNDKNVIWFENGKFYKNVNLELKDNQTVYIEGGAIVQGSIFANNKKNIKICGRGILDGSLNFKKEEKERRFLQFTDCKNVSIDDIILQNGTTWQVALFHCSDIQLNGMKIVSEGDSDDGIDIVRCKNVVVDNAFIHTKDDCIAIKSHGNYPFDESTDNILVKNSVLWNSIWGNALEIGFELWSKEVKNIRFHNIDIIHTERAGAALSIHNAGPAHVHHITFEDIRIEDVVQKLFDLSIFFSKYSPDGIQDDAYNDKFYIHGAWDNVQQMPVGKEEYHSQFRGKISNVTFRNIHVVGGLLPFSLFNGFSNDKSVSNIKIENLTYLGVRLTDSEKMKLRTENTYNLIIK